MTAPAHAARDAVLRAAFWYGTPDEAIRLLAAQPDLARDDLFVAAAVGDDAAVRRLLAADPGAATRRGGPRDVEPIVYLCFSRFLAHDASRSDAFVRAATALLDAGADPNAAFFDETHTPHPERESALYGAAGVAHHAALTALLLARGADPNDAEVPYHAPEGYDNGAFRVLLESGRLTPDSLETMLLRKCDWHDLEGVRLALDHGANPNAKARWQRTALHHAILSDNALAIVELLLDRGADPTIVADDLRHGGASRPGTSAIGLAARRGRADVLDAIERRGWPTALAGAERLLAACAHGDADAARVIAAGDPHALRDVLAEGGTVLAEFAGVNNAAGVGLLLDLGVPVDAPYERGDVYFGIAMGATALHVAAWRAAHDVVDVLIARGADVNARTTKSETPLMLAVRACVDSYWAERRSPRSVRALLDAGAHVTGVRYPSGYAEVDALLRPRKHEAGGAA